MAPNNSALWLYPSTAMACHGGGLDVANATESHGRDVVGAARVKWEMNEKVRDDVLVLLMELGSS